MAGPGARLVAGQLGSSDALTAGRSGSWEADPVDQLVKKTVGYDDEYLPGPMAKLTDAAWGKIREQNPGIADPVFDLTPGREMFCASVSWDLARPIIEFNLMRDGHKVTGAYLLERLLHNAAHALIFEPGKVAPTSGRYHTVACRDAAQRVGLDVEHNDPEGGAGDGWSETSLAKGTLSHYRNEVRRLDRALAAWTPTETPKTSRSRATANAALALCSCQPPRRIRVRESALDKGSIVCSICGQPFVISASDSSDSIDLLGHRAEQTASRYPHD